MVLKSLVMLFNFEGTVKAALSATCGDNSEEDPPVPIPNTVVKLLSADDTWGVTLWEIRTSPLFLFFEKELISFFLLLFVDFTYFLFELTLISLNSLFFTLYILIFLK